MVVFLPWLLTPAADLDGMGLWTFVMVIREFSEMKKES